MRTTISVFCLLALGTPVLTIAATYSIYDYNPDYLPYNFEEAINYRECSEDLKVFDDTYQLNFDAYVDSLDNPSGMFASGLDSHQNNLLQKLDLNRFNSENAFRECIEEGFALEEEERIKDARENSIQQALIDCDFNFFSQMTTEEKMATYDERKECEEKANQPDPEPIPEPITPTIAPVSPTPITYTPPPNPVTEPVESVPEEIVTVEAATTSMISEESAIELTEDQLNNLVEERVAAALQEQSQEPKPEPEKPSILKRIVNFFFGWL